jgi:hypothetical protein
LKDTPKDQVAYAVANRAGKAEAVLWVTRIWEGTDEPSDVVRDIRTRWEYLLKTVSWTEFSAALEICTPKRMTPGYLLSAIDEELQNTKTTRARDVLADLRARIDGLGEILETPGDHTQEMEERRQLMRELYQLEGMRR